MKPARAYLRRIVREALEAEMEEWSVRDDRPYERPAEGSHWMVPAIAIGLVVVAAGAYAWWHLSEYRDWSFLSQAPSAQRPAQAPTAAPPAPAPAPQAEPEARHPIPEPAPEAEKEKPLPALGKSDPMAREALAGLVGRKAFAQHFVPDDLVRRIVATIDNLPRENAPRRMVPLHGAPGAFVVKGSGEEFVLDSRNFARYEPFVRVLESLDARDFVSAYVRAYPLFQRAYRELGYPKGNFNDRLVDAIDDLLAAPEVEAPIRLVRPKVLYQFADPDLEALSAGQKAMLRMGDRNAARVKAKLREIRRELVAAGERRP
jgi:hypothetical protein